MDNFFSKSYVQFLSYYAVYNSEFTYVYSNDFQTINIPVDEFFIIR